MKRQGACLSRHRAAAVAALVLGMGAVVAPTFAATWTGGGGDGDWFKESSGTDFGTIGVEFRYDHVAAGGKTPELYRYNTTAAAWQSVAAVELAGYRLAASGLAAQGTAKIGWFAVAVSTAPPPTAVLVR